MEMKAQLVVDSSVILSYIFPDEEIPEEIQDIFNQYRNNKLDFYAPDLMKLEVANALRSSFLSKRATEEKLLQSLKEFLNIPIFYENPNIEKTLANSLKHKISVYDSQFFTLAEEKRIKLISLDKHLRSLVSLNSHFEI